MTRCTIAALLALSAPIAMQCWAGEAEVISASASCDAERVCNFTVAVEHEDTGWEHYADHWRVLTADEVELGKRILLHPHVTEQPFTRSLGGISVPHDVRQVVIEAHDSVHGYGGSKQVIDLP